MKKGVWIFIEQVSPHPDLLQGKDQGEENYVSIRSLYHP